MKFTLLFIGTVFITADSLTAAFIGVLLIRAATFTGEVREQG